MTVSHLLVIGAAVAEIFLATDPAPNFPDERNDHEEGIGRNAHLLFTTQISAEVTRERAKMML